MASRPEAGAELARPEPRTTAPAEAFSRRVVVERIRPDIDSGRFPIKRTVGESVDVSATIFADGHDVIVAVLRDRTTYNAEPAEHAEKDRSASSASSASIVGSWNETPMTLVAPGTDEWRASFGVDAIGWHEYEIVAWVDRFLTWRRGLCVEAAAQQDTDVELGVALLEGSMIVREAAARAEQIGSGGPDSTWLLERADRLSDSTPAADRVALAADEALASAMATYSDRSRATVIGARRVWVDRERARFGAWYE